MTSEIHYINRTLAADFGVFFIYKGKYIYVFMSPNKGKVIDIIIGKACFLSGDKSGDNFLRGRVVLMPFGKYRGEPLAKIPDAYLEWLMFEIDLREPLRSAVHREFYARSRDQEPHETAVSTLDANRIKSIYWDLARQYHPDKGGNGDVMKGINLFYEAINQ